MLGRLYFGVIAIGAVIAGFALPGIFFALIDFVILDYMGKEYLPLWFERTVIFISVLFFTYIMTRSNLEDEKMDAGHWAILGVITLPFLVIFLGI